MMKWLQIGISHNTSCTYDFSIDISHGMLQHTNKDLRKMKFHLKYLMKEGILIHVRTTGARATFH
jgi:hypothetical protein